MPESRVLLPAHPDKSLQNRARFLLAPARVPEYHSSLNARKVVSSLDDEPLARNCPFRLSARTISQEHKCSAFLARVLTGTPECAASIVPSHNLLIIFNDCTNRVAHKKEKIPIPKDETL